jgi:hypothetical protein
MRLDEPVTHPARKSECPTFDFSGRWAVGIHVASTGG